MDTTQPPSDFPHADFPGADFPRSPKLWLAYGIYQVALHLLLPVVVIMILLRARKEPLYRAHFMQRFGIAPRLPAGPVWVYATSLGETRAVSPVIRALLAKGHKVLLTHSSPAGLAEGRKLFAAEIAAGDITSAYIPLDTFWAMRLFLRRTRPVAGIVVESEIWPAQLFEAARRGIPMFHVNGNYLEKSYQRDRRRFGGMRLQLFSGFAHILTKSADHVARYIGAGVPKNRVHLVGDLKFDQAIDPAHLTRADALRARWPKGQQVLFIASSVKDEEEALIGLVQDVLGKTPDTLVVWAPRSPQRFKVVAQQLQDAGYSVAKRSTQLDASLHGTLPVGTQIFIGDSLGEMNFYYQLADLVFVGASLNDHGGHNIIEPLALGKPVLMGPSFYGIEFPAYDAMQAGAFESLPNADALAHRIVELFQDADALNTLTINAQGYTQRHTGAAQRSYDILAKHLTNAV